jgi:hypothetical protein
VVVLAKYFEYETNLSPSACEEHLLDLARPKHLKLSNFLTITEKDDVDGLIDFKVIHGFRSPGRRSDRVVAIGQIVFDDVHKITRIFGQVRMSHDYYILITIYVFMIGLCGLIWVVSGLLSNCLLMFAVMTVFVFSQIVGFITDFDALYNRIFEVFKAERKRKSKFTFKFHQ